MRALVGQPVSQDAGRRDSPTIVGRFWARLWDLDCVLELRLDSSGNIAGSFSADGEPLEVASDAPDLNDAVRGVIRARNLTDLFASFQAQPDAAGLWLEVIVTGGGDADRIERVLFERLF